MVVSHIRCFFLPCFCVLTMGKNACSKQRCKSVGENSKTSSRKEMKPQNTLLTYYYLQKLVKFYQENGGRPSYLTYLSSFPRLITLKQCDFPVPFICSSFVLAHFPPPLFLWLKVVCKSGDADNGKSIQLTGQFVWGDFNQ